MRKLNLILLLTAVAVFTASCDLKRMVKKYDTVKYETKPQMLEVHGGKVNFEAKGIFPKKYFGKKVTVDLQPELRYEGGSQPLKKITIVGEKVKGGGGNVIKKKGGGSFTSVDEFAYIPEMFVSEVFAEAVATKGKKTVTLGTVKLADGIIATSQRVGWDEITQIAPHGYVKEVLVTKKASLFFDYNSSNLTMAQKLNKIQENIAAIDSLKAFIERNWEIKDININSWASPEGELTINTKLSDDRGKAGQKYFVDYMNSLDHKKARELRRRVDLVKRAYTLNVNSKGEDFDGFMSAIQASALPEKQTIINVIKMQSDKLKREQEIKNMAVIYAQVEAILEPLRRAEIVVTCFEPRKTDAQISELSIVDPSKLNDKELLYAATMTDDIDTKLKIYKSVIQYFPDNWKGYNNAGALLLEKGQMKEAISNIEKANAISPNNPLILNNLGVIALRNKESKNALSLFERAQAGGVNVNYNTGILKIINGDYDEALRLMAAYTCKYNIALVQVLTGKNTDAVKTLDCIKDKKAEIYYLMAIIGSRTANTSMMYDNLKKACAENSKYKSEAAKDREFLKYHDTADFQSSIR